MGEMVAKGRNPMGCSGYFGGETECDSKESGMVFGAAAKGMHKSAVAAGQSREQEGRLGEKSSRSEGEKDEFVGSEKRNSLGRRRRRLRRSLSPLSPFRFYDRRRDPRSLPPSMAMTSKKILPLSGAQISKGGGGSGYGEKRATSHFGCLPQFPNFRIIFFFQTFF